MHSTRRLAIAASLFAAWIGEPRCTRAEEVVLAFEIEPPPNTKLLSCVRLPVITPEEAGYRPVVIWHCVVSVPRREFDIFCNYDCPDDVDRYELDAQRSSPPEFVLISADPDTIWGLVRQELARRRTPSVVQRIPDPDDTDGGRKMSDNRAVRSWGLGRAAESRGATNVARLHYELAARHGSRLAKERLELLAVSESTSRSSRDPR